MNINNIHNTQMSRWEALGTNLTLHATFNVLERSKNWLAGSKSGKHKVTWELNVKNFFTLNMNILDMIAIYFSVSFGVQKSLRWCWD